MGTFWAHLEMGSVLVLLALWWMVKMYKEYIKNGGKDGFHVPMPITISIRGREIPLEIYLKLFFPLTTALIEARDPYFVNEDGNFTHVNRIQHISFYSTFTTHAIINIMRHHKLLLIEGLDDLTWAFSFIWSGAIFYFHNMFNSDGLETIVHYMAMLWCLATGACVLWEFRSSQKFVPCYCKVLMMLGLGTWFVHTPFFLYEPFSFPGAARNPNWDRNSHDNYMFVAALFGFHLCFNIIVSVVVYLIVKALSAHSQKCRKTISFRRIPNGDCERLDEQETLLSEEEM